MLHFPVFAKTTERPSLSMPLAVCFAISRPRCGRFAGHILLQPANHICLSALELPLTHTRLFLRMSLRKNRYPRRRKSGIWAPEYWSLGSWNIRVLLDDSPNCGETVEIVRR